MFVVFTLCNNLIRPISARYMHEKEAKQYEKIAPKDATISLRLSKDLLEAVKKASDKRGIGYQKFIRESIERAI